jgi:ligand-binding sensor domain-containing protein/two-component sensor histidine kinase
LLKKAITILLILFAFCTGEAQHRTGDFMVYSGDNGLPACLYYRVFQSSDGYLWIGSSSGMVRFDGKRYKTFFSSYTDSNSLSDNIIVDFAEDQWQNLWIAGFMQGLTRYNLRTGQFKQYARLSADKTAPYGINRLLRDKDGYLWVATAGRGLARYMPVTDKFEFFIPDPLLPADGSRRDANHVTGIAEDVSDHNLLWLSCFDGLYLFNKKTKAFQKFQYRGDSCNGSLYAFLCVETDNTNNVWLGTWFGGMIGFDKLTHQFKAYPYAANKPDTRHYLVLDIKSCNDSTLYLAAGNGGLLSFHKRTGQIKALLTTEQLPEGSSGINLQRISITPDAGIFAGGNYHIYQQHKTFGRLGNSVYFNPNTDIGFNHVVYDAYRKGYWMVCNRDDKDSVYFFNETITSRKTLLPETTIDGDFEDIAVDKKKRVWAIASLYGMYQLQDASATFRKAIAIFPGSDTLAQQVKQIETDRSGNCWLLTRNKVYYWNVETDVIEEFDLQTGNEILRNLTFCAGLKNDVWVASSNGLYHCTRSPKKITHVVPDPTNKEPLARLGIKSMTVDRYGNAWLGFESDGVQIVSADDHSILSTHDLNSGLPGMQVNYMTTDTAGRIWAGTPAGLALFDSRDPAIKVWQLFNRNDGIKRDYIDRPIIATKGGLFFLNIENGFSWFDSDAHRAERRHEPVLHITSFNVNGEPYKAEMLPDYLEKVSLPYDTREISIEYAAMDWLYPARTKYFYLVEGIHQSNGWIMNPSTAITLTGLKPGTYYLRIYAVNGDGVRSKILRLPIVINPAFWQRWWFLALCIVVLLGMVYALYRYRIRELKKMQSMRNTISRNLHDDIGASLSNISILNELTRRNIGDPEKATGYIATAGEDIQRISESLSDIVWNINPKYDDIANLFVRMKRYAADMLDGKNITAALVFPNGSEKMFMPMDQRRDFYLIFKEAVNNLAKYSKASKAEIEVWSDDHTIHLRVSDNGKGFNMETIQQGNGIQNMRQRAEKWKATLRVESTIGTGTIITLDMKI